MIHRIFEGLINLLTQYNRDENKNSAVLFDELLANLESQAREKFNSGLKSKQLLAPYQRYVSDFSENHNGEEYSHYQVREFCQLVAKGATNLLVNLEGILNRLNVDIPRKDLNKEVSRIKASINTLGEQGEPISTLITPDTLPTRKSSNGRPRRSIETIETLRRHNRPNSVRNRPVPLNLPAIRTGGYGNPVTTFYAGRKGISDKLEDVTMNVPQVVTGEEVYTNGGVPSTSRRMSEEELAAARYLLFTYAQFRQRRLQAQRNNLGDILPGAGNMGTIGTSGTPLLTTDLPNKYKRMEEARAKLGRTIPSNGVIEMGTFQENEEKNKDREARQNFISTLLKGMREIFGKNPLYDLLRWGFLWLGKNHPILAAIGLTLPLLIGPLMGLFRLIKGGIGAARFAFNTGKDVVSAFSKGGAARTALGTMGRGIAATWSNHPIANGTNPSFVRNIATASGQFFSTLGKTSLIQNVTNSGVGRAVGGFMNNGVVRGAGKALGRIPVLGTALSFMGNMVSGKSLGESATRAGAGTIGATIGGALGTLLGPIGTVIGSVVGGLLGEWVGGKLFGLINRNSNKTEDKLNQIEENTNWLEKIFSFFSKKTKDTDPKNTGGVPLDSYGQGTSVLTPEQAKFNAENAKYLTIYNMRKRGFNDRDIISAGENIKGGVTRADIAAYDQLIRQGKMDYALRTYNSNNAMVQDLKKQGASRDFIISKLTASPEAQAAAQSFLVGRMDQQNGFNLSEALKNHRVTSGFGYRIHPKGTGSSADGKSHFHGGIDIAYGEGEAVRAFTSGKVISVGNANDGYGNVVKIMDDQGRIHQYAHGSKFGNIQVGQRISAGDTIMYAGHTGFATGSHLDYRISKNGKWINPLTGEMSKANAKLSATQKAVATATATQEETSTSVATASNGLRQSVFDRVYGKDSSLAKAREIIFTATDVTGSLGVWGITQVNNTGRMRT